MIPFIQLAPMEGVLDFTLREMLAEIGGVDRMVTEFVRVTDRLLPAHVFARYSPELERGGVTSTGVPVFVQLLGGQPEWLAANADLASELGAPGIDLNFGCPAKTVNRHDGGAVLLQKPERVFQIVRAVRRAVPLGKPVTAKVRLGYANKDLHREIAQAAEEGGADHLVVHARTKLEMYTPPAHWDYIARMRVNRQIPILANGDIWTKEDCARCQLVTGSSGVALGRGLVRRPALAREIRGEGHDFQPAEFLAQFFARNLASPGGAAFAVARGKQLLRYWCAADNQFLLWFNRFKIIADLGSANALIAEWRRENRQTNSEESACQSFKSTLGPIAPTASAPKIF